MLQKILLAIGDTPDSPNILAAGLGLAEKLDAQIMLLHVINPSTINGFSPLVGGMFPIVNDVAIEQYLKELKDYEQQGIERLRTFARQAEDRGIKTEISQNYGDSGPIICEVAKSWAADTILMGRNQKSLLSEIFLGSTSNYVVHHAPCSVMLMQFPALS